MSMSAKTSLLTTKAVAKAASLPGSRRSLSSSSSLSAAEKLIQRRATTGSVSSVFYLKTLPGDAAGKKQASLVENAFVGLVGVPIAFLGLGGLYRMASDGKL